MSIPMIQRSLSCMIPTLVLLIYFLVAPIIGIESRKLDETGIPGPSDPSVKCGGCSPCGHPSCYSSPPPPSLPPPPPPPPKNPPSTTPYCPPPPSIPEYVPPYNPGLIAPPGELYPVVYNYSKSPRNLAAALKMTFGFGLLAFLFVWT